MQIREMGLSKWATNCLYRAGITTVEELRQKRTWELQSIRSFGAKCLREVQEALERLEAEKPGCEYCSGQMAEYQYTCNTKLYINTFGKARTIETECNPCPPFSRCSMRGIPARSAFIINYCPNCGRNLEGESRKHE